MNASYLTRRRVLAPLASLALATLALAPAHAQPAQPGTAPRGLTADQKSRLNAALRYLTAAKRQVASAKLSAGHADRINGSIDTALRDLQAVLSGRVREPRG